MLRTDSSALVVVLGGLGEHCFHPDRAACESRLDAGSAG